MITPQQQRERRDVYITEELDQRRTTSAQRDDQLAFIELGRTMLDSPADVLPALVDLALHNCRAVAGGLSILEPEPAPGVFRWHHLRGTLSQFSGATTPRHYSPCGIVVDDAKPVLVQKPERLYTWLGDAGVGLPECLLVPLALGSAKPIGTLWVVSEGAGQFTAHNARSLQQLAAFAGIALAMIYKSKELEKAVERETLLAREMGHRVRNVLALADAIIRMTAKSANTPAELARSASSRLQALSRVHRKVEGGEGCPGISLADLLEGILLPFTSDTAEIAVEGSAFHVGPQSSTSLALLLHELATNAVKYGALGRDGGRLEINWREADGVLTLTWTERTPVLCEAPAQEGFGLGMCARMAAQLHGSVTQSWSESGLIATLNFPSASLVV